VPIDESGHVVVGPGGRTDVEGIWAVGDLTTPMAMVVHAAATGAITATWIVRDLVFAGRSTVR
jgi:thioredoxin reductase